MKPGLVLLLLGINLVAAAGSADVDQCNLTWDTPSKDSSGSMPIGNGDIGLNVWVEADGDLLFYLSKTDAFSENGQLLKLGRVRLKFQPNPFTAGQPFRQGLRLRPGEIAIRAGTNAVDLRIWVDANRPVIHVEAGGARPFTMTAGLELWRTRDRTLFPDDPETRALYELDGAPLPVTSLADTVVPTRQNQVTWYHRNSLSTYPVVLTNQHLDSLITKYPDPLLNRTFGGCMKGPGMVATDDRTLRSGQPAARQWLDIHVLTAQTKAPAQWLEQLATVVNENDKVDLEVARQAHLRWWKGFWERSWIYASGSAQAEAVTRGYAWQRWMEACAGRGNLPMKFNGSIFTVDAEVPSPKTKQPSRVSADYRAWGGNYWFQNTRLLYWPLVMSGDYDLIAPWLKMYADCLPFCMDRTAVYYHHAGASFMETMYFWGTPNNANFGWGNAGVETVNPYIRRYWQGGLELTAFMLDCYDHTQDDPFVRRTLVPLADAITIFFDQHWPRDAHGKLHFDPAQSLETWHVAVNPMPEIAGLGYVLPRLLALPERDTAAAQRDRWKKMLSDLPPIPVQRTEPGMEVLLPAETFSARANSENPELYAVFPFRLYGVGRAGLDLAKRTFAARRFHNKGCWGQDGMQSACLGLTDEAKASVVTAFTRSDPKQRFPAFWVAGNDWTPDMDNGGGGMLTLQLMLVQADGKKIRLLPAWPRDWDATFKLHAPYRTTVEGTIRSGRLEDLRVTPAERRRDVEIMTD